MGEKRFGDRGDFAGVRRTKKRTWGALNGEWVPHDVRDLIVDFVSKVIEKTEISLVRVLTWIGRSNGKYFDWKKRYGKINSHNGKIPRDHWLSTEEKESIIEFHKKNPLEGYRRLAFMMIDKNVCAVSQTSVYRVLSGAGLLDRWNKKVSKKGTGFVQPLKAHEHWHIDVTYINISGTFYYLAVVLDGASRAIIHHEIRASMKEEEIELILQRSREKFPGVTPRIISDNGPQFLAKDFKEFIRLTGMTHVRTSPYYPQSNGKLERVNKTLKVEAIRPAAPGSIEEARRVVARFVEHYNSERLHSAIGYIAPSDFLAGKQKAIWAERDRRLEAAREERRRQYLNRITQKAG